MIEAGSDAALDPREAFGELVSATHALVEWYASTGALGLPVDGSIDDALASIAPSPPTSRARAAAPQKHAEILSPPFGRPEPARHAPSPLAAVASAAMPSSMTNMPAARHAFVPMPPAQAAPPPAPPAPLPIASAEPNQDRRVRLAQLASETAVCMRCGLHEKRKQAVFARGNPFAELCFVGEGPGADEDAQGEPFVGAAGQLLDKMIAAMGYTRDDVYICNIVKCRPPNNRKPEPEEIRACVPFVREQIALVQPKVIVALGATAASGLLNTTVGITRLRGTWKLYNLIPVMPTFHPAYLLRNGAAKREVWKDLQEVMQRLGKSPRPRN